MFLLLLEIQLLVQHFQAFVQGVGFRTEVERRRAARRQILHRVVQNRFAQNPCLFEFIERDEFGDEIRPMLDELLILVRGDLPHDVHPVAPVRFLEADDVGAIHVAELGVELRAKCTPMEDAVADRADNTACQSATDDRHQQCKHGIAGDYIILRHGKSQV
jgi:hypothetical protein